MPQVFFFCHPSNKVINSLSQIISSSFPFEVVLLLWSIGKWLFKFPYCVILIKGYVVSLGIESFLSLLIRGCIESNHVPQSSYWL
jgi:hypothetical protein